MSQNKHTSGPWGLDATLSSNTRHIRRITDEDGHAIADVRYKLHASQEENLANAKLIAYAPSLFERGRNLLLTLEEQLTEESKSNPDIIEAMEDLKSLISKLLK